jgi:hypothetical protein
MITIFEANNPLVVHALSSELLPFPFNIMQLKSINPLFSCTRIQKTNTAHFMPAFCAYNCIIPQVYALPLVRKNRSQRSGQSIRVYNLEVTVLRFLRYTETLSAAPPPKETPCGTQCSAAASYLSVYRPAFCKSPMRIVRHSAQRKAPLCVCVCVCVCPARDTDDER